MPGPSNMTVLGQTLLAQQLMENQYLRIAINYDGSSWDSDTATDFINKITLPYESSVSSTSKRFNVSIYRDGSGYSEFPNFIEAAPPIFPGAPYSANIITQMQSWETVPAKTIYIYVKFMPMIDGTYGTAVDMSLKPSSIDFTTELYVDKDTIGVGTFELESSDSASVIPGCTDPTANNYDSSANLLDGSCTYDVLGCMDDLATNYDPTATVDDGSCLYHGCILPAATNYGWTAYGEVYGTNNNNWTVTVDGEPFLNGHAYYDNSCA